MKHTIILLVFCTLFISNIAYSVTEEPVWNKRNVKIAIAYYADKYNVSASTMDKVVNCESGYNPNAVNWQDSHKLSKGSHGVAQFSKETFGYYAKQMGEDYTDPYNPKEALDVMGYMFSKKQQNQWSCYKKVT